MISGAHALQDHAAFEEMKSLQSLANLKTIEINRFRRSDDSNDPKWTFERIFQPGPHFFALLETRHPLLCRILLTFRDQTSLSNTENGVLWEKSSVWGSRRVPYLEYWDILWHGLEGACLAAEKMQL